MTRTSLDEKVEKFNPDDLPTIMRLSYQKRLILEVLDPKVKPPHFVSMSGWLTERIDYHEDGSKTRTCGIELSKEDFLALGGKPMLDLEHNGS